MAGGSATTGSTGLPSNVAAALACILLIGGIIFYVMEKRDSFVRFYAMQSIIFGGAWLIFSIIWNIGAVIIWIIAMIKAFSGARWDIPYIGPIARNQIDGTSVP